jgi:phosphate starvation-inducible PhoH-like protein
MRKKKQAIDLDDYNQNQNQSQSNHLRRIHLEYLTEAQRLAHEEYQKNDILFLIGAAGTGKSHLAIAFALQDIAERKKAKILLSRPVVEAGENLGFLPGEISNKLQPFLLPMYDCLEKMCARDMDIINKKVEIAPIAYLRGRTFENAICILDEAQNCTAAQLKLFLTRLGKNSKMIITGDPSQSDLNSKNVNDLLNIINKIRHLEGIGTVEFSAECIVRHPLIREIVKLI